MATQRRDALAKGQTRGLSACLHPGPIAARDANSVDLAAQIMLAAYLHPAQWTPQWPTVSAVTMYNAVVAAEEAEYHLCCEDELTLWLRIGVVSGSCWSSLQGTAQRPPISSVAVLHGCVARAAAACNRCAASALQWHGPPQLLRTRTRATQRPQSSTATFSTAVPTAVAAAAAAAACNRRAAASADSAAIGCRKLPGGRASGISAADGQYRDLLESRHPQGQQQHRRRVLPEQQRRHLRLATLVHHRHGLRAAGTAPVSARPVLASNAPLLPLAEGAPCPAVSRLGCGTS